MKKILIAISAFILSLGLVACGNSDTIKFAVFGPITGPYSVYGEAVKNGAELAASEINDAGGVLGKELELVVLDNQADSDMAINNYNYAVDQKGVVAIIGGTFSGLTNAFKPYAVEEGIPVLTPTGTAVSITEEASNVFRACYLDSYQGAVMAQFAINDLSSVKAAVLFDTGDDYSVGLKDAFVAEYVSANLTVDAMGFTSGTVDFSTYITSIKNGGYDAVFVPTYTDTVGPILTEAKSQGLDIPFLGGDGWDSIESTYATAAEGMYFGNHYAKSDTDPLVQNFVTAYTDAYGEAPNALAALAYDAVKVMVAAIDDAQSVEYADVIAALNAITYEDGVTGSITFDDNGDAQDKAVSIIKVENGAQVLVKKYTAA
ncbi:MAG: ABC transporter substrate-binding protein [Acholeplasmataceae bacterium]